MASGGFNLDELAKQIIEKLISLQNSDNADLTEADILKLFSDENDSDTDDTNTTDDTEE